MKNLFFCMQMWSIIEFLEKLCEIEIVPTSGTTSARTKERQEFVNGRLKILGNVFGKIYNRTVAGKCTTSLSKKLYRV